MTKDEALKLGLEALEGFIPYLPLKDEAQCNRYDKAITAIKEALAQPEQEPVAWWNDTGTHIDLNVSGRGAPLYKAQPQRTWVGMTEDEAIELLPEGDWEIESTLDFAQAIEAKLRSKNENR